MSRHHRYHRMYAVCALFDALGTITLAANSACALLLASLCSAFAYDPMSLHIFERGLFKSRFVLLHPFAAMLLAQHAITMMGNHICSKAGACGPDGPVHAFAGVPTNWRHEVMIYKSTRALTAQVICLTNMLLRPMQCVLSLFMTSSPQLSHDALTSWLTRLLRHLIGVGLVQSSQQLCKLI